MSLFRYEALDRAGVTVSGTAVAGTSAEARADLRTQGLHATRLEPVITAPTVSKTMGSESEKIQSEYVDWSGGRLEFLSEFSRHMAMLLRAGLPLAQALNLLAKQLPSKDHKELLEDVGERVKEGAAFEEALAVHPKYFPELFISVAHAGSTSGHLSGVLSEISGFYTRQKRLRDKVISALTYPALMLLVGTVVLGFLMAFVVPRVTAVLIEQKKALPWPTEVLLFLSNFIRDWWWLALLGVATSIWLVTVIWRSPKGRRKIDKISLNIPILGTLLRKQAIARWADTMSNLLSSGISVSQSLAVTRGALNNRILAEEVMRLEKAVLEGRDLSDSLKDSAYLPTSIGFAVGVGEESGELSRVLKEIAAGYHEEVEVVSGRLTDLVNPILIVCMGVAVGFIVAAILLPITDFSQIQ